MSVFKGLIHNNHHFLSLFVFLDMAYHVCHPLAVQVNYAVKQNINK